VNGVRELRARVRTRLVFYSEVLSATREVGAFSQTSAVVADAVAEPLAACPAPRAVLEVGAGTGALTRGLLRRLGRGDRLDLCEINPRFARLLEREIVPVAAPTVRVFAADAEALPADARYDVIVSSLPWLNFEPAKVERILARYEASLRAGGTIAYVDYWANGVRTLVSSGPERRRLRQVLAVTRDFQRRHLYRRRIVPWNVPPACVHYLTKRTEAPPAR
jgi:phospholipid N-methyltransferase